MTIHPVCASRSWTGVRRGSIIEANTLATITTRLIPWWFLFVPNVTKEVNGIIKAIPASLKTTRGKLRPADFARSTTWMLYFRFGWVVKWHLIVRGRPLKGSHRNTWTTKLFETFGQIVTVYREQNPHFYRTLFQWLKFTARRFRLYFETLIVMWNNCYFHFVSHLDVPNFTILLKAFAICCRAMLTLRSKWTVRITVPWLLLN